MNKKADVSVATLLHSNWLWESEVVFMEFILFLIYGLLISTTLNIALLTYIVCKKFKE